MKWASTIVRQKVFSADPVYFAHRTLTSSNLVLFFPIKSNSGSNISSSTHLPIFNVFKKH